MFENVYLPESQSEESQAARSILTLLFDYYKKYPWCARSLVDAPNRVKTWLLCRCHHQWSACGVLRGSPHPQGSLAAGYWPSNTSVCCHNSTGEQWLAQWALLL